MIKSEVARGFEKTCEGMQVSGWFIVYSEMVDKISVFFSIHDKINITNANFILVDR